MLSRQQFFGLTRLNSDGLAALKRRDHLPLQEGSGGTYTAVAALGIIIADRLVEGSGHAMNRSKAAEIVRDAVRLIAEHGRQIARGAANPKGQVLVGRIVAAGRNIAFCGGRKALSAVLAEHEDSVTDVMLTSVSRAFLSLQARAARLGIELAGMWPDPASLPSATERKAAGDAAWDKIIAEINLRNPTDEGR